jgi:hypothetical protein
MADTQWLMSQAPLGAPEIWPGRKMVVWSSGTACAARSTMFSHTHFDSLYPLPSDT